MLLVLFESLTTHER